MELLKKRWKYYLPVYLFIYLYSLSYTGIPNLYYLTPIKVMPMCLTLCLGNLFYYTLVEKQDRYTAWFRGMKYVALMFVILIICGFLGFSLNSDGIDITPFMGM